MLLFFCCLWYIIIIVIDFVVLLVVHCSICAMLCVACAVCIQSHNYNVCRRSFVFHVLFWKDQHISLKQKLSEVRYVFQRKGYNSECVVTYTPAWFGFRILIRLRAWTFSHVGMLMLYDGCRFLGESPSGSIKITMHDIDFVFQSQRHRHAKWN